MRHKSTTEMEIMSIPDDTAAIDEFKLYRYSLPRYNINDSQIVSSRNHSNTETLRSNSESIPWLQKSNNEEEKKEKRRLSVIQEKTDQSESKPDTSSQTFMQKRTYIESNNDLAEVHGSVQHSILI